MEASQQKLEHHHARANHQRGVCHSGEVSHTSKEHQKQEANHAA